MDLKMKAKQSRAGDEDITTTLTRIISAVDLARSAMPILIGQAVLGTMSAILLIIKDTIRNKDDFRDFVCQCEWVRKLVQTCNWTGQSAMNEALSEALTELSEAIDRIYTLVNQWQERRLYKRFFSRSVDKERIKNMTTQLGRSLKQFELRVSIAMAESLRKSEEENLGTRPQRHKGLSPPARPAIFHGRQDLIRDVCGILLSVQRRHVALLGGGGIGKSSIAKAVLNEEDIKAKFGNRRFFVRFDDFAASQITYRTFTDRIGQTIGTQATGDHDTILDDLSTCADTFLVLDNAEAFLDSEASGDVSRIKSAITEFGDITSVSILLTSRNHELPHGLHCSRLVVPNLGPLAAYKTFVEIYQGDIVYPSPILERLLSEVDYHALTVTLLASAAGTNAWSLDRVEDLWNAQRTRLLDTGHGKDENLAHSIELSLTSPCIRVLGDYAQRVLRIIAFFPQGVHRKSLDKIFPSIPQIHKIIDALHKQSLVLFVGGFVTMLMPIRFYVMDAMPLLDDYLLKDVRSYYYQIVNSQPSFQAEVLVASEDVNVESLLIFDLQTLLDSASLPAILETCESFILCLKDFKPRSTSLRTVIEAVPSSGLTGQVKMKCFHGLSGLSEMQSNRLESLELANAACNLANEIGDHKKALELTVNLALFHEALGNYNAALRLVDQVQASPHWDPGHYYNRGVIANVIVDIRLAADTRATTAALTTLFSDAQWWKSPEFQARNRHFICAKIALLPALIDNDAVFAARAGLESAIAAVQASDNHRHRIGEYFNSLGIVAFIEGEIEDAKQLLQLARSQMLQEKIFTSASWILLELSVLAVAGGLLDDARNLIKQAGSDLKNRSVVSDQIQWCSSYMCGVVELAAGRFIEAYQVFERTKKYCESRQEFYFRALSLKGMGETACLHGDAPLGRKHFMDVVLTCSEAGINPGLLHRHYTCGMFARAIPHIYDG